MIIHEYSVNSKISVRKRVVFSTSVILTLNSFSFPTLNVGH